MRINFRNNMPLFVYSLATLAIAIGLPFLFFQARIALTVKTPSPTSIVWQTTDTPTDEPTPKPTDKPSTPEPPNEPTSKPTDAPPTPEPTDEPPTPEPPNEPTSEPTDDPPTPEPSDEPPTPEPTDTPTVEPTPTPTPISLLPAVVIDNKEPEQAIREDGANSFRKLRWQSWSDEAPEGWYYVINFLPANDPNSVFFTTVVPVDKVTQGKGDDAGWLIYEFDINSLPENENSCYPYWDVIVGIDAERVNCPQEPDENGICRLTKFPKIQQSLATAYPSPKTCPDDGDNNDGGSREGTPNNGNPGRP